MQPFPWVAQVVGWWQMAGHGQSKADARAALAARFEEFRANSKPVPRPGRRVALEYASTERVHALAGVARDFMPKILGYEYDQCFVSDESSLWDFHHDETNAAYHNKIALLYEVDVSDIENGNLAAIFERIRSRRSPV
jgi:hypothetical protein